MASKKNKKERTRFTTTIDKKILLATKKLALEKDKKVNDLIEEALKQQYNL